MPGPSQSAAPQLGADAPELKAWRAELKALDAAWPKELAKANRQVAQKGAQMARNRAAAMGGVQTKAAGAIKGLGTQVNARIAVNPSQAPMANVAFWGAKRHTGWYAAARYDESRAQHPQWIGTSWDVAVDGEGPYAINAALAEGQEELAGFYGDAMDELTARAFPD